MSISGVVNSVFSRQEQHRAVVTGAIVHGTPNFLSQIIVNNNVDVNYIGRSKGTCTFVGLQVDAFRTYAETAIFYGRMDMLRNLVDQHGLNLNQGLESGRTLLMQMCSEQKRGKIPNADTVKAVIDMGANPHLTDENGNNALHLACFQAMAFFDGADYDKGTVIVSKKDTIKVLLEAGVNPNTPNNIGRTPLHFILEPGCGSPVEDIKMLLDHAASLDVADKKGVTPRMMMLEQIKSTTATSGLHPETKALFEEALKKPVQRTAQNFPPPA
jgi:ankyrin repeat protein